MLIHNDLLGICDAIKMIDENYYLEFNQAKNRYEIHNKRDFPSYSMAVPFDELDFRTVKLLYDSHIARRKEFFEKMEKENQNIENENKRKSIEDFCVEVEELL